jgi:methylphosphotriester-DNA--protein-cysteine methyltransferase
MANPTLYGVSTTRIFCRFGCPSRPPKPENVIYFLSSSEAVLQGFRPCKRCRPDQEKSPTEAFATFVCHQLLEMGRANPSRRIEDHATQLVLSKRQLERIVRASTGQSPRVFIQSACRQEGL